MAARDSSAFHPLVKDETGNTYGLLTVISRDFSKKRFAWWICRCECGKEHAVVGAALRNGKCRSCGCLSSKNSVTHGNTVGGESPEYKSWLGMRERCVNARNGAYPRYGGRGITVCERWMHSFENFLADMGVKPSRKHSIDRIDNDGPYSPDNCRWATQKQQCNNRRSNVMLTFNGETHNITTWAAITGMPVSALQQRKRRLKWDDARILTTPVYKARGR